MKATTSNFLFLKLFKLTTEPSVAGKLKPGAGVASGSIVEGVKAMDSSFIAEYVEEHLATISTRLKK